MRAKSCIVEVCLAAVEVSKTLLHGEKPSISQCELYFL